MVPSKREVKVFLAQKTNIPYNSRRGKVMVHWIIDRIREREFHSMEEAFKKSRRVVELSQEDIEEKEGAYPGGFEDLGYIHGFDNQGSWGGEAYSFVYYANGSVSMIHQYGY